MVMNTHIWLHKCEYLTTWHCNLQVPCTNMHTLRHVIPTVYKNLFMHHAWPFLPCGVKTGSLMIEAEPGLFRTARFQMHGPPARFRHSVPLLLMVSVSGYWSPYILCTYYNGTWTLWGSVASPALLQLFAALVRLDAVPFEKLPESWRTMSVAQF